MCFRRLGACLETGTNVLCTGRERPLVRCHRNRESSALGADGYKAAPVRVGKDGSGGAAARRHRSFVLPRDVDDGRRVTCAAARLQGEGAGQGVVVKPRLRVGGLAWVDAAELPLAAGPDAPARLARRWRRGQGAPHLRGFLSCLLVFLPDPEGVPDAMAFGLGELTLENQIVECRIRSELFEKVRDVHGLGLLFRSVP